MSEKTYNDLICDIIDEAQKLADYSKDKLVAMEYDPSGDAESKTDLRKLSKGALIGQILMGLYGSYGEGVEINPTPEPPFPVVEPKTVDYIISNLAGVPYPAWVKDAPIEGIEWIRHAAYFRFGPDYQLFRLKGIPNNDPGKILVYTYEQFINRLFPIPLTEDGKRVWRHKSEPNRFIEQSYEWVDSAVFLHETDGRHILDIKPVSEIDFTDWVPMTLPEFRSVKSNYREAYEPPLLQGASHEAGH